MKAKLSTYGEVCKKGDTIDISGTLCKYEGSGKWRIYGTYNYYKFNLKDDQVISPQHTIFREIDGTNVQIYPTLEEQVKMKTKKTPVTTPAQAKSYLRSYLETNKTTKTTVANSKARWATAAEISSTYSVDKGWLGRLLQSAPGVEVKVSTDGKNAYRIKK